MTTPSIAADMEQNSILAYCNSITFLSVPNLCLHSQLTLFFFNLSVFIQESCNLGQNICRLFHVLVHFLFTINETEVDYYHQKVTARVASPVAEQLNT